MNDNWISIDERLPTQDECRQYDCDFLVTPGNREIYISTCVADETWHEESLGDITKIVTHWQPLPEPPK